MTISSGLCSWLGEPVIALYGYQGHVIQWNPTRLLRQSMKRIFDNNGRMAIGVWQARQCYLIIQIFSTWRLFGHPPRITSVMLKRCNPFIYQKHIHVHHFCKCIHVTLITFNGNVHVSAKVIHDHEEIIIDSMPTKWHVSKWENM